MGNGRMWILWGMAEYGSCGEWPNVGFVENCRMWVLWGMAECGSSEEWPNMGLMWNDPVQVGKWRAAWMFTFNETV